MLLRKPITHTYNGISFNYTIAFETPNSCPRCHYSITPDYISCSLNNDESMTAIYFCTNCNKPFLCDYDGHIDSAFSWNLERTYPIQFLSEQFDDQIHSASPTFTVIFNQAHQAETMILDQISGVGYRKALEFLVKDYAILLAEDEQAIEQIKHMSLVQCIENNISHPRIKPILKRAAWIGNDETHYIKKYNDEDIETLKSLIKLSVYWITMDLDSRELEQRIIHPSQLEKSQQD